MDSRKFLKPLMAAGVRCHKMPQNVHIVVDRGKISANVNMGLFKPVKAVFKRLCHIRRKDRRITEW